MHIARTEGHFIAIIRVADAAGGQMATVTVRGDAQKENQSQTSQPEHPAPAEVKAMALRQALVQGQRLYLPWIENREMVFMDGKECNLREAIEPARSSDYAALLKVAQAGADSCATGSKAAAQASYNLGVAFMLVRRYDDALAAFDKAKDLSGGRLVAGLVEECQKESAAAKARQPKAAAEAAGEVRRTGMVLTNDLIIRLVDGNVAEDEIIKMIATQPARFALGPDDVSKLKAAGVPDRVVDAMRGQK
jgi:tetratricopeptide (TPR) repeat protein